jgi:hypothetical protein
MCALHDKQVRELLYAICVTLNLETWDDLPEGDTEALLESVERAQNARTLAAYLRGLRAANAAAGREQDALPGDLLTREKIGGAVARGWCHPLNAKKEMDTDLCRAITNSVCDLLSSKGAVPAPEGKIQTGADLKSLFSEWLKEYAEKFDGGSSTAKMGAAMFLEFLEKRQFQPGADLGELLKQFMAGKYNIYPDHQDLRLAYLLGAREFRDFLHSQKIQTGAAR